MKRKREYDCFSTDKDNMQNVINIKKTNDNDINDIKNDEIENMIKENIQQQSKERGKTVERVKRIRIDPSSYKEAERQKNRQRKYVKNLCIKRKKETGISKE